MRKIIYLCFLVFCIFFGNIYLNANENNIYFDVDKFNDSLYGEVETGYVIYKLDEHGNILTNHKGEKIIDSLQKSNQPYFSLEHPYIYIKATPKTNFEFLFWGYYENEYINLINESFYVFDKDIYSSSKVFTAYFISQNENIIKYYNDYNYVNLKHIEILKRGSSASYLSEDEKNDFNFIKWSESLNNVTNDLKVYPIYEKNINETDSKHTVNVEVYNNIGGKVELGFAKYQYDGDGSRVKVNDSFVVDEYLPIGDSYNFSDGYFYIKAIPYDGYEFYGWVYQNGDYKQLYHDKIKIFNATSLNKNYTFYAYFKTSNQHVVTYVQNLAVDSILNIEVVDHNFSAQPASAPKMMGKDFKKWSQDLTHVDSDLTVYPIYHYNVFSVFRDYWSFFLIGLLKTLLFSVLAVFLSLLWGAIICLLNYSKNKVIYFIGRSYVEVIRGVPMLLQLLLIYALVPRSFEIGVLNAEIIAVILALFINSSAYVAEIYRSGIQTVDKGQMEACRALGMSDKSAIRKVIIPQAIKNVLPSIGNELIMVIKETSLAASVDAGIGELMSVKKTITAATYINIPPYLIIAVIYFLVTFSLSRAVKRIERRLALRD